MTTNITRLYRITRVGGRTVVGEGRRLGAILRSAREGDGPKVTKVEIAEVGPFTDVTSRYADDEGVTNG